MKEIPLTQGKVAIVDDEDFDFINQWKWYSHRNGRTNYAVRKSPKHNGKQTDIMMHRVINKTPKGLETDHINGDGTDNRKENLRNCTIRQNQWNSKRGKDNSTGYRGVSLYNMRGTTRYRAMICSNKKLLHIGIFLEAEEAAMAYDKKAIELFGEFARTNFGKHTCT